MKASPIRLKLLKRPVPATTVCPVASVRLRSGGDIGSMSVDDFIARVRKEVVERKDLQ